MATKKTTDTEAKVAKKATAKSATEKTTAAAKKATTTKKAEDKETKKTAAKAEAKAVKKATKTAEIMLQYGGKQISFDDIQAKVKDAWKNQFKMKLKDFVNVQIYIKPEDGKAYFVVNGNANVEYFVEL